jgi:hypothetical protein
MTASRFLVMRWTDVERQHPMTAHATLLDLAPFRSYSPGSLHLVEQRKLDRPLARGARRFPA